MKDNKILLIDDNELVLSGLKGLFSDKGFTNILLASGGAEGLIITEREKPDLIVLDINMPDINGMRFLKELRKRKIPTRVIMLSAYTSVDLIAQCIKYGATDFVTKTTKPENLIHSVERALALDSKVPLKQDDISLILNSLEKSIQEDTE